VQLGILANAPDEGGPRRQIAQYGFIGVAAVTADDHLPLGCFGALIQALPHAGDSSQTGQRKSSQLLLLLVGFVYFGRGVLFRFDGRGREIETHG